MGVLLQISDPHFGTEQPPVVEALLALAAREQPEVVVWSGDITQRARRAQFEAASAFARRLDAPHVLAIPGNHDIPLFNLAARLLHPYRDFLRAFKAEQGHALEPELSLPGVYVSGVNTTRAWRHKNGEVSRRQIDRVARRLRQCAPGVLRVVVIHQPLWIVQEEDRGNLLRGHAQALEAWGKAGADIIMGGHIHLPYVRQLESQGPDGSRPLWIVQAGTALSSRVRGGVPNSVNLIRYQGRRDALQQDAPGGPRRVIERWDFDNNRSEFRQVQCTAMGIVDFEG
ncbi:MAG: metallophosphoesterase [Rubrivivax sp.]|nr:MAG: metallophosphoesterase [Rubrivivax sp.]